jgi:hypothetical protein
MSMGVHDQKLGKAMVALAGKPPGSRVVIEGETFIVDAQGRVRRLTETRSRDPFCL